MNENPQESPSEERSYAKWGCAVVLGLLAVVGGIFFWRQVEQAREAGRRCICTCHLKQIATAMHHYHDKYGCFPPAYVADKQGRPMHSWRVLLMPFFESETFNKRYRFDEPWNSPHNLALSEEGAPLYHCPSDNDSSKLHTSYVMVVGPRTISDGPTSTSMKEITDGLSNTIMIVEMSDSGIHWMEPRNLKFDEMSFKVNDRDGRGIRSRHPGRANIVFCDTLLSSVDENVDPELLRGLLTRNGGEDVGQFFTPRPR